MPKNIIVTGVHHTPAIELFRLLSLDSSTSWSPIYLTHSAPKDTHLSHTISQLKVVTHTLVTSKLDRRYLLKSFLLSPLNLIGFFQSLYYLVIYRPQVVVSFGGYASFAVVVAAWMLRFPILVHEQTLTPSLALKLSAPFATKIALSVSSPALTNQLPPKKTIITGNLLRAQIFNLQSSRFKSLVPLLKNKPLIYVTGGGQGSQFINNLIWQSLPLLQPYLVIHQVGNYPVPIKPSKDYLPLDYVGLNDIGWVLGHAALIISRAGANTTQELMALNKKSIIIPHPFTQQDEQIKNALWLKKNSPQKIVILKQSKKLTPLLLINTIKQFHLKPNSVLNFTTPPPTSTHPFVKLIYEVI